MKNYYAISIPNPCHEDWNTMTPKEKGKFCDSCAKTVIDFTKMSTYEIQDFISENQSQRICGHFKQTQLDSINLFIPKEVIEEQKSFHKAFLLILLIVMGTTFFNCTNNNGKQKKIDSIEIIDSINNNCVDVTLGLPAIDKVDSISSSNYPKKEIESPTKEQKNIDEPIITGDIVEVLGLTIPTIDLNNPIPFALVEQVPQFKNTPKGLNAEEKRKYFTNQIAKIVSKNFMVTQGALGFAGKQKIYTQFKINERGNVVDIKVRAPHPKFESEAVRVLKLLPQFIPAIQGNKPITVIYSLPIVFQAEEQ
ncbi:energy transducer TonB [Aestuariivivens insulae]|uniref:energy transducer TonB n=1 Tax=Aestuariivivens insulae TaxID=1621988 RepID=UPI001F58F638|nr:energy transducer TonB [Aestuariivivens insulae]